MTQNNNLPPQVSPILTTLGEQIRIARKRRGLRMEEMASRMFVNRKTLSRLEKGEGGVALSVLASALWVLGMEDELLKIADPRQDTVGIYFEKQRLPKRIRISGSAGKLDF